MSAAEDRLTTALADRYRLERELGQGGMATVYLAEDLRHRRKVALKVLRPELAAVIGAERFLHEITTTANLQHPHILPLHDSGQVDGTVFYVMPFVEGESLRERLTREKQLPVEEAVRIAREVAGALDYAHRHGVIHRDIKPENILLHDGSALVADFGIALAASRTGGSRMTETGMSLGTPHYMSPEQAMGERALDARTDIYALGCVCYEMLQGEPPFTGPTAQAIVARVVTEEPRSLTLQRKTIPTHVEAAVRTALAKLPADRFASAGQFAEALKNPSYTLPGGTMMGAPATLAGPRWRRLVWPAVALVFAAVGLWGWLRPRPVPIALPGRFVVVPPDEQAVGGWTGRLLTISPDGSRIIYVGIQALSGTDGGYYPFFSPDGEWVGFASETAIKRVPATGGSVLTVTQADERINYAHWGRDGTIVFSVGGSIFTVPAAGGPATKVPVTDSVRLTRPELLPDGRAILITRFPSLDAAEIGVIDRATGELKLLGLQGTHPHYVSTGHLVYGHQSGAILAVPFDLKRREVTGPPTPVLEGVHVLSGGATQFAVAENGTAVYLAGALDAGTELVQVDLEGKEQVLSGRRQYRTPRFSPDGRRIVVEVGGNEDDLYVLDVELGNFTRLTFKGEDRWPLWSRDGKFVTYRSERAAPDTTGLYRVAADGSGSARLLLPFANQSFPGGWSLDGRQLVYSWYLPRRDADMDVLTVDADTATASP